MSPLNNVMLVTCEVVEHREMILMTFWIGAFNCVLPSRKPTSKKEFATACTDFGQDYFENGEHLTTEEIGSYTMMQ